MQAQMSDQHDVKDALALNQRQTRRLTFRTPDKSTSRRTSGPSAERSEPALIVRLIPPSSPEDATADVPDWQKNNPVVNLLRPEQQAGDSEVPTRGSLGRSLL